ncbi:MAG: SMP-30/gluconolactonase/LRE family protein [Fibrobacterota bacterium]|nr:SMP-30/gluconolactonase/LRE family protein [Fibrobacterota bacterium]
MLRFPEDFRNLQVTHAAFGLACLALLPDLAAAQDFGTHDLSGEFAEPGTKVISVMSKAPEGGRNLGYSEGPAVDGEGNLYFTENDPAGETGNIWKVTHSGQSSNFYNGPGVPNGLEFDNGGKLFSAEKGVVATYDIKMGGASRSTLSMNQPLNSAFRNNDVSVGSNGGIWFTNHGYGNQYFYRDPNGQVTVYNNQGANGVSVPNGIEWLEEKKLLLICSSNDNQVYQFDVGADFKASNKRVFGGVPVPDGLTVDEMGNVYVASYGTGKVYVFGPTGGKEIGMIDVKTGGNKNISNCAFGGPGNKTLFMTGTNGAYKIQWKIAGRTRPSSVGIRTSRNSVSISPTRKSTLNFSLDGRKVTGVKTSAQLLITIQGIR